MTQLIIKSFNV